MHPLDAGNQSLISATRVKPATGNQSLARDLSNPDDLGPPPKIKIPPGDFDRVGGDSLPAKAVLARKWPGLRINRMTGRWHDEASGSKGEGFDTLLAFIRNPATRKRSRTSEASHD